MLLSDERVFELIKKYGSPLYVYDENILRKSCRDMHDLLPNKTLRVNYSAKANSNLEILKLVRDEDIDVDAMSDQDLLNSDLRYGLRLDSLDIVDMVLTLERDHHLVISEATVVETIKKGGTVGKFIEAVNQHSLSAKK
jgi:acyl carrier protein